MKYFSNWCTRNNETAVMHVELYNKKLCGVETELLVSCETFLRCKKFPKYSGLYKARGQCRRANQASEQWKKAKKRKTLSLSLSPARPRFSCHFWVSWKLWIFENHMCELRSEQLYEGRLSQLYTQLLQLRKDRLKKIQACTGFEQP